MHRPGRPRLLLEIDLTRPIVDSEPDDVVGKLRARQAVRWRRLVAAVADAAGSTRIAGLIATVGTGLPMTAAQELREAVEKVAAAGKPTIAWAESFGEMGNGGSAYLLASGFDDVWLQPSGTLAMTGVAAEVTFLRGVLDKVGVVPEFGQRHEYKSAADRLMREEFTPAHREMMQRLTDSAYDQLVAAVAAGRRLSAEDVASAMDRAPLLAPEALDAGLVDRLGYRDEVYEHARERCRGRDGRDPLLRYADQWSPPSPPVRKLAGAATRPAGVALVDVHGAITEGRSRRTLSGQTAGSTTVARQLRAAREDKRIAAVVLRVDSPGGSAVASDTIWHEVRRVRSAGKPVVVSMGALAASGGYFISCGADVIVAHPATLTGSIGVVGGKADISPLLDRLGVTTGAVERGAHARMFSLRRSFTDQDWQFVDGWLDAIYADFTAKVAQGRSLSAAEVEAVARGRVWTGTDARDRGLVDSLGGLRRAVTIARGRAGLPESAPVRPPVHLPMMTRLRPPRSSDHPAAATVGVSEWLAWAAPDRLRAEAAAALVPRLGDLLMPPVRLSW